VLTCPLRIAFGVAGISTITISWLENAVWVIVLRYEAAYTFIVSPRGKRYLVL
jgi:hypothetical protein